MNRIILIGNGFDLAHGLETRYGHFINDFWERKKNLFNEWYRENHHKSEYLDEDIIINNFKWIYSNNDISVER